MNEILNGDCIEELKKIDDNSIDSIVTDPPYELGFMNKEWDKSGIAFNEKIWEECLRVLKPGGHMLVFGGSRTFHRIAVAVENAGFVLRDTIMWVYGSGFPKNHDISKAIDKKFNAKRKVVEKRHFSKRGDDGVMSTKTCGLTKEEYVVTKPKTPEAQMWEGWGTALKPAFEPIMMFRKSLAEKTVADNVLEWGTGGINIDACRVPTNEKLKGTTAPDFRDVGQKSKEQAGINKLSFGQVNNSKRIEYMPSQNGRWPANFIHDGSEEAIKYFPETKSKYRPPTKRERNNGIGLGTTGKRPGFSNAPDNYGDEGSVARYFYCAKAARSEREKGLEDLEALKRDDRRKDGLPGGDCPANRSVVRVKNNHPTVKPLKLMCYLVRLVTPANGVVLDPFAGSGTTLIAAYKEGFRYIGIELEEKYVEIAEKRLEAEKPLFSYQNE
jgi:site-specific DNA-methyltransferase (adenine-specific)